MEEPLIWSPVKKMNLPVSSLRYETGWHDGKREICFRERYFLGEELVRENVHVLQRQGESAPVEQNNLGG